MYLIVFTILIFSAFRTGSFLSSCWANSPLAVFYHEDKDHCRFGEFLQTRHFSRIQDGSVCCAWFIYCHYLEILFQPTLQRHQNRKAVCPLYISFLHSAMGNILVSEKNHLHGVLLHTKSGIVQHTLSLQS